MHLKGQELLFNLSVLQNLDQLNTATGRAETVEFKPKVIEFQRDTATYSEKPSFSTYRSDFMKGVKKLMQRLNEKQLMHEKSTPTPSSIVSSSYSDYIVNKLKIKLPRFDGNTLHWNSFWENFEEIIKAEHGMVEPHKKNALIEAMQCPKAKEVVETESKGSYSYMLDRLSLSMPCPEYTFTFIGRLLLFVLPSTGGRKTLIVLQTIWDYHVRGLQEIAAATFEHIVAHLVVQSFSKECREQWDRFEGVSSNPPVLSQVVDFIQQASLRLSGREEIEESPSTFYSSSSKPAAGSKQVKAFQTIS